MKIKEQVLAALRKVNDQELGINIVDLGLIYGVAAGKGGEVRIAMSPTTPFCPYLPEMIKEIEKAARGVSGVKKAIVAVVWTPPWTLERMSPAARAELGMI
ncbi:MAG: metal-sulfur cluster assembly factor [Patescibacteria group bacterium]